MEYWWVQNKEHWETLSMLGEHIQNNLRSQSKGPRSSADAILGSSTEARRKNSQKSKF